MKKTILVVLIAVMIATPCFAQDVEPEGMFSIEGTFWNCCIIGFFSMPPFVGIGCVQKLGFYQGKVYICTDSICTASTSEISSFNDLVVVSTSLDIDLPDVGNPIGDKWSIFLAIMQPIGIGVCTFAGFTGESIPMLPKVLAGYIGIMFKINDNWTPPEVE